MKKFLLAVSLISVLPGAGENSLRYVARASQNETFCTPVSDGEAMYIRNVGTNRVIDVPYASYQAWVQLQCYPFNGTLAQRFVFEKQFLKTYSIKPLGDSSFNCAVNHIPSADSMPIALGFDKSGTELNLKISKFGFISVGNGTYKVKTHAGMEDYYLATDPSTNKLITTKVPTNASNLNYYLWKLEKADNLTAFDDLEVTIAPHSKKLLLPAVAYNGPYTISSSRLLGSIEIRENNATTLLKKVDNATSLQYRFAKNKLYDAYFYNNTSSAIKTTIKLRPDRLITAYSAFDYIEEGTKKKKKGQNQTDRSIAITGILSTLESHDFYVRNYCNLSPTDFLQKKSFFWRNCHIRFTRKRRFYHHV